MAACRKRLWEVLFGLGLAVAGPAFPQQNPASIAARSWRETHEVPILREFMDLLAIPNLARDDANIRKNAAAIVKLLEKRGVKTQLLEVPGAPPVVFGEIATPGATRTLVFYAHYDGQPLDPKEWATPPWQPVLRDGPLDRDAKVVPLPANGPINPEWRIYARCRVRRQGAGDRDRYRARCVAGSPDSARAPTSSWFSRAKKKPDRRTWPASSKNIRRLLGSDVWLICDGPGAPKPAAADCVRRARNRDCRYHAVWSES